MHKVSGAVGAAVLLSSILISAQAGQSVPTSGNERSTAWFVELSSPPAVEGSSVATLDGEEAAFHNSAAAAGVNYTRGRSFRKLWNGITVGASPSDTGKDPRPLRGSRGLPGGQRHAHSSRNARPAGCGPDHGARHDGRRHCAGNSRLHRPRRDRGGHRYRDRLRPSRPRRMLRPGMPGQQRVRLRRRRVQQRQHIARVQPDSDARSISRRLQRPRYSRQRHRRRERADCTGLRRR